MRESFFLQNPLTSFVSFKPFGEILSRNSFCKKIKIPFFSLIYAENIYIIIYSNKFRSTRNNEITNKYLSFNETCLNNNLLTTYINIYIYISIFQTPGQKNLFVITFFCKLYSNYFLTTRKIKKHFNHLKNMFFFMHVSEHFRHMHRMSIKRLSQ